MKNLRWQQSLRVSSTVLSLQFLIALCLSPVVVGAQTVIPESPFTREIGSLLENGDLETAIDKLENAKNFALTHPASRLLLLATAYNMDGRHGFAITSAIAGIELAPEPDMLNELYIALGSGLMLWEVKGARAGRREVMKEIIEMALLADQARLTLCGTTDCELSKDLEKSSTERSRHGLSEDEPIRLVAAGLRADPRDVTRPEMVSSVVPEFPEYTAMGKEYRVQGSVMLEAVIDKRGRVNDIEVLRGLPLGLTSSAVAAVRQWTFKSAIYDAEPVAVYYIVTMDFSLDEEQRDSSRAGSQLPDGISTQRRTIAEMRRIGIAMLTWFASSRGATSWSDAFTSGGNLDPQPAESRIDSGWSFHGPGKRSQRLNGISRSQIIELLVPHFIEDVPRSDDWGYPYQFAINDDWEDGVVLGIRSAGEDGHFESAEYELGSFPELELQRDIVWVDGYYIRWPVPTEW